MSPESPRDRRLYRTSLAVALGLAAAFFAWVHHDGNESGLLAIVGHAGLSLTFVGKFIVFAGLTEGAPSPWQLAGMVFLLDMLFAFALASGIEALERAPLLGRGLRHARTRAQEVLAEYPGLQRRAFFGVALFVFLPLAGTGAITGSFLARIFGLTRFDAVRAIALGSAVTALIFAALAHFVGAQAEAFLKNPVLAGLSTLVLLFVAWRAYLRFLKGLRS
ncbi:MAG TPA: small multi-drug export protein [Planctomycetota bacterium]